jgi:prepilin-type N-terminal cleavage/methylation domain-containing protein
MTRTAKPSNCTTSRLPCVRNGSAGHASAGFTLVELMMAVSIALLCLSGIFMTTTMATKNRQAERDRQLAMAACELRMEQLRAMTFAQLPGQNNLRFQVDLDNDSRPDLRTVAGTPLPGVVTVTTQSSSGTLRLYRVRTSVRWQSVTGIRTVSLESFIGNRRGE